MNKKLLEVLLNWPKSYISGTELYTILNKTDDARHAMIKRAIQEGYLIPLRRDFYLIKNAKAPLLNAFEVAALMYGPSYVSFESALSYHGWIPEAVRSVTSASVKRAKEYTTPIGIFSYEHIPVGAFSFGVQQHRQDTWTLLIAAPIKALADMIYARKRIWKTVDELYEDLRIEPESFQEADRQLLAMLIEHYPSPRVKNTLRVLLT